MQRARLEVDQIVADLETLIESMRGYTHQLAQLSPDTYLFAYCACFLKLEVKPSTLLDSLVYGASFEKFSHLHNRYHSTKQ